MIDALLRWSLHNRLIVLTTAMVLLVWGAVETSRTPVDVFPDLTAPTVTVLTEAHGMAPEEVETQVTFPIETALGGAAGVRRVRSSTAAGISVVWVEFDWGTDIFRARQTVSEKLQLASASFPPELDPPVLGPVTSIMGEVLFLAVQADEGVDPMEVRSWVDWTLRPRLLAVSGVSQVIPIGGDRKTLLALIDEGAALEHAVGLKEISAAVREGNENASAGFLSRGSQESVVRGLGRIRFPEQLDRTVVRTVDGHPIMLGDLADVAWRAGLKRGEGSYGASPAVVVGIQKQPTANTLELTARVDTVLDELEASAPGGVVLRRDGFRQSDFIGRAVGSVSEALRDGAILVVVIVVVFLGSGRATLITALAIPLSLVCTVLALNWIGANINTMTLGGMAIAVGALVDDAIIDTENVVRRLRENHHAQIKQPVLGVVFEASREIRASIVFATLVIGLVFVPVFFLDGVEGRLLAPLGFAYIVSLFASLLVALTVTPVLCLLLLPSAKVVVAPRASRVARAVQRAYAPLLALALRRWKALSLVCAAALVVASLSLATAGRSFLPTFNEGALTVSVVTLPGTSLEQSNALGSWVERILLEQPEVASTTRRTGRAELDEHAQGVHAAEIDVRLDIDALGREREPEAFLAAVREAVTAVPGTTVVIGQPISHRIDHMLSGTRANIAIKIFGPQLDRLAALSKQVRGAIESIDGVVDVALEQQPDVPTILADFDRDALASHGLSVHEVAETLEMAVRGLAVSRVIDGNRGYDIVLRLDQAPRDLEALGNVLVTTPSEAQVPLRAVARLHRDVGPSAISRENTERKAVVSCNVADRDLGSVVAEIQAVLDVQVDLPAGYRIEYGGQFQSAQQASQTLLLVGGAVLLGIFVLLVGALSSVRDAIVVLVNLPLALIGGVAGVTLTGGVLSVASLIGFITLFGIATRNGIMLVSHIAHLVQHEGVVDLKVAVTRGAIERIVPICMTAVATALGLAPLVLAAGDPGSEIQAPMAVVILCGLVTSTGLNMLLVPALYLRMGTFGDRRRLALSRVYQARRRP